MYFATKQNEKKSPSLVLNVFKVRIVKFTKTLKVVGDEKRGGSGVWLLIE
jgi:hypothetical protein